VQHPSGILRKLKQCIVLDIPYRGFRIVNEKFLYSVELTGYEELVLILARYRFRYLSGYVPGDLLRYRSRICINTITSDII
jgi:hypothetical protein